MRYALGHLACLGGTNVWTNLTGSLYSVSLADHTVLLKSKLGLKEF